MSFLSNLITAPLKSAGNIIKGAVETVISPFKAAWDAVKTIGTVGWDFVSLQWTKIPGDAVKGTIDVVKDLGQGPLDMIRGTVGLGSLVVGTAVGAGAIPVVGGAAGYAAAAQFADWIN